MEKDKIEYQLKLVENAVKDLVKIISYQAMVIQELKQMINKLNQ